MLEIKDEIFAGSRYIPIYTALTITYSLYHFPHTLLNYPYSVKRRIKNLPEGSLFFPHAEVIYALQIRIHKHVP